LLIAIFKGTHKKIVFVSFFIRSLRVFPSKVAKFADMSKKRFLFVIISAWVFASGERVEKAHAE
jgi:hypothetical protein